MLFAVADRERAFLAYVERTYCGLAAPAGDWASTGRARHFPLAGGRHDVESWFSVGTGRNASYRGRQRAVSIFHLSCWSKGHAAVPFFAPAFVPRGRGAWVTLRPPPVSRAPSRSASHTVREAHVGRPHKAVLCLVSARGTPLLRRGALNVGWPEQQPTLVRGGLREGRG